MALNGGEEIEVEEHGGTIGDSPPRLGEINLASTHISGDLNFGGATLTHPGWRVSTPVRGQASPGACAGRANRRWRERTAVSAGRRRQRSEPRKRAGKLCGPGPGALQA